jgi:hypothetical protein
MASWGTIVAHAARRARYRAQLDQAARDRRGLHAREAETGGVRAPDDPDWWRYTTASTWNADDAGQPRAGSGLEDGPVQLRGWTAPARREASPLMERPRDPQGPDPDGPAPAM